MARKRYSDEESICLKESWANFLKISFINLSSILVYFTGCEAFSAQFVKCNMKTANASKQIYKFICLDLCRKYLSCRNSYIPHLFCVAV